MKKKPTTIENPSQLPGSKLAGAWQHVIDVCDLPIDSEARAFLKQAEYLLKQATMAQVIAESESGIRHD
jgi:hypothetical protein